MTIWISLFAVLISLGSLILSYKNTRRSQRLDVLERRTQLLYKISEVNTKIVAAGVKLSNAKSDLKLIESAPTFKASNLPDLVKPLLEELIVGISDVARTVSGIEESLSTTEKGAEEFWKLCDKFTEEIDPRLIEKMLPRVQKLQVDVDKASTYIENDVERLIKRLSSLVKRLDSFDASAKPNKSLNPTAR